MSALRPVPWILARAAAAGLVLAAAAPAQLVPGSALPPLAGAGLSGELPSTEGRVVLLDFWASWCAPCKSSFPAYAALDGEYRARGLVIVAVSVDENASAYAAFVARQKPPFATLRDAGQRLVAQVQVPTMPTCYLVDRRGRVRFVHTGFRGGDTERALRKEIEGLLAEPLPAP